MARAIASLKAESPLRVAIVADFAEERWPSMDLVAQELTSALKKRPAVHPPQLAYELVRPPMERVLSLLSAGGRIGKAAWAADRFLNRFVVYPRHISYCRGQFDLFHLTDHSYSQLLHEVPAGRGIVTCHDLDTFRCLFEDSEEPARRNWMFAAMARRILEGFKRAAHVLCVSAATRDELLARGFVSPERISIIPNGVSVVYTQAPDANVKAALAALPAFRVTHTVDLLHVGSVISRKRIDVLLEVFARVKNQVEPRARLLRVGGAFTAEQRTLAGKLGLGENDICVLPFLSPEELAEVYRSAVVMLLPSETEGFGLPIIEALACGTPVIVSDLPVLREVGGDAASYAPVANIDVWVRRVQEILSERRDSPSAWEARQLRCQRQGRMFSWENTAFQTIQIYQRVLAEATKNGNKLDRN